jgi:hypothetical protein
LPNLTGRSRRPCGARRGSAAQRRDWPTGLEATGAVGDGRSRPQASARRSASSAFAWLRSEPWLAQRCHLVGHTAGPFCSEKRRIEERRDGVPSVGLTWRCARFWGSYGDTRPHAGGQCGVRPHGWGLDCQSPLGRGECDVAAPGIRCNGSEPATTRQSLPLWGCCEDVGRSQQPRARRDRSGRSLPRVWAITACRADTTSLA